MRPSKSIADVQSEADDRRIAIERVGVKGLTYPITVRDRAEGTQATVASVSMYVSLPHQFKGTHMSRFVEILNDFRTEISVARLPEVLQETKRRLSAESAHFEAAFPYFIEKRAPVTGAAGLMEYNCRIHGIATDDGNTDIETTVAVPVTTVCPCSREISDRGAHNQRGLVTVTFRSRKFVWMEDVITLVEANASCEVYSLIKREDEKAITERAYDHPMFVEDVVRTIAKELMSIDALSSFVVAAENFESIHNHNAYAEVVWSREKGT